MLRIALAIVAFLCVVAYPTPVNAAVDQATSGIGVESLVMTLPGIAILLLHHVKHRRRAARAVPAI